MKRRPIHIAFLAGVLLGSGWPLVGQHMADDEVLNAPVFRERFYVQTDKSLYEAGEPVRFRIFNLSHALLKAHHWSNVLYIELINSRNNAVAQGKFMLDRNGSSGKLLLPDTASTGEYYLRAYTRWMMNFPSSAYAYVPLAVVHPLQLNVTTLDHGDSAIVGSRFPGHEASRLSGLVVNEGSELSCETERQSYDKRTRAAVRIRTGDLSELDGGLAVSVVRREYLERGKSFFSGNPGAERKVQGPVRYIPETRGVSLEGKIVKVDDGQPVPSAIIDVTLLGPEPDYIGLVSDKNGEISLMIPPNKAARNALITIGKSGGATCRLDIKDPFSTQFLANGIPRTDYFSSRLEVIEEMMMLTQLKQAFGIAHPEADVPSDSSAAAYFYGSPEYVYKPADYIPIPNLEEFFFELVPQVVIRERQGEYLVVMVDDAGYSLEFAPLILLDHVAVKDLAALFKTDPQLIEHIDVINSSYIRGGNYYGGIISLISREGNLAGVGLPEGSTIIDLQTFPGRGDMLRGNEAPARNDRIPDLRTLLYWNPQQQVSPGSDVTIEFFTSDIAGSYVVSVTGMTASGEIVGSSCAFQVE